MTDFKVDYIGIGAPRSGTGWIHQCLSEHPQICGSKYAETNFLNDPIQYNRGLNFYASFFPHCKIGQIRGEYTPGYLAFDDMAHSLIKKWFPEVKFIVCLRNPIERAYSNYIRHKTSEKTRAKTFEEAIKDEDLKPYYIDMGFYYSPLKKYFELYPRERFLILIYEDIAKGPLKFIQGIYKFLGVDPNFVPSSINKQINWSAQNSNRIPFLTFAITKMKRFSFHHQKKLKPMIFLLRILRVNKLIEAIRETNSRKVGLKRYPKPQIPPETRLYLQNIYREEIKNLEKLINKDLSFWQ